MLDSDLTDLGKEIYYIVEGYELLIPYYDPENGVIRIPLNVCKGNADIFDSITSLMLNCVIRDGRGGSICWSLVVNEKGYDGDDIFDNPYIRLSLGSSEE